MKITQLIALFFVLISLLTYSSCSKDGEENLIPDENTNNNFLTAKIDGDIYETQLVSAVTVEFDTTHKVAMLEIMTLEHLGHFPPLPNAELFKIIMFNRPGLITPDTYSGSVFNDECELFLTSLSDVTCAGVNYARGNSPESDEDDEAYYSDYENSNVQITITDIDYRSGGFVIGAFSGTLVDEEKGKSVDITDGEFNLSIN